MSTTLSVISVVHYSICSTKWGVKVYCHRQSQRGEIKLRSFFCFFLDTGDFQLIEFDSQTTTSSRNMVLAVWKVLDILWPVTPKTKWSQSKAKVNPSSQKHRIVWDFSGTCRNVWTDLERLKLSQFLGRSRESIASLENHVLNCCINGTDLTCEGVAGLCGWCTRGWWSYTLEFIERPLTSVHADIHTYRQLGFAN